MGNLNIGTDVIAIKDAVKQIRRNIRELKEKKSQVTIAGETANKILRFYDEKIAAQKVMLLWLRRSI